MTPQAALLKLMNLPASRFAGVVRTADGYYIAQEVGDIGYNAFLGAPNPPHNGPGRDAMLATWNDLTDEERQAVVDLAAHPLDGLPIRLAQDFGVPIE